MFSQSAGNLLQLLALAMEVIGISLAAIELRFPKIAEGIATLHGGGTAKGDLWLSMSLKQIYRWEHTGNARGPQKQFAAFILIWWGALAALGFNEYLNGNLALVPESTVIIDGVLLMLAPLIIAPLGPLVIFLCARLGVFIRSFAEGRSIGSLGLVIAFLGLLLEFYQVLTVAVSDQPSISLAPTALKVIVFTIGVLLTIFTIYIYAVVIRVRRANKPESE